MAINPMQMMKLAGRLKIFQEQHSRVLPFMRAIGGAVVPGTVIEMKVTTPDGRESVCNIKVTPEDVESVQMLRESNLEQ